MPIYIRVSAIKCVKNKKKTKIKFGTKKSSEICFISHFPIFYTFNDLPAVKTYVWISTKRITIIIRFIPFYRNQFTHCSSNTTHRQQRHVWYSKIVKKIYDILITILISGHYIILIVVAVLLWITKYHLFLCRGSEFFFFFYTFV